jgi:hypothetical protein
MAGWQQGKLYKVRDVTSVTATAVRHADAAILSF